MKSNRGFSLLETLLYLGIFAIVGGSLFGILTNVVRISTKEVSGDEVASQLNFTMTTLNRLVREASNIETATTTATTTLKLRMADPLKDPTCVILSGGVLKLAEGPDPFQKQNCTSTTTDITTNKVVVDRALFRKAEFPGGHDQILLDLQFSNLASGSSKISRVLRSGISRVSAATFDSDLLPNVDAQYEVGLVTPSIKRWKNISISGLLNLGTDISDPAGVDGSVYYNSTNDTFRGKANGVWADLGSTLWKATSTSMYSNVTGNVGIGTQSPGAKLDIAASGDGAMALRFSTERPWVIRQTSTGASAALDLHSTASDKSFKVTSLGGNRAAEFLVSDTAGNNKVYLVPEGGNVGIGTINPVARLSIAGGSASWSETTPGLTVGSMHLDPESATDHFGSAITFGASDTGNGENAQAGIYTRSDGGYGTKMYFATTDAYASGSKTRIMIDSNGNVGIGTAGVPSQKLDVNGYVKGTGLCIGADCRTTWPASAPAASTSSNSGCSSAGTSISGLCVTAGNGQIYWVHTSGSTGWMNASGVVPTSRVSCSNANTGISGICVVNGNGQIYWVHGSGSTGWMNTSGVVPESKSACAHAGPNLVGVCVVPGNGQIYWVHTSGSTNWMNAGGVTPNSNVSCSAGASGIVGGCLTPGNGQMYWVSASGSTSWANTAGVVSD